MALALALKRLLSSNLFSRSFRPVGGVAQPGSSRMPAVIIKGEGIEKDRYTMSVDLTNKPYKISDIKAEMMKNGVLKVFVPYQIKEEDDKRDDEKWS